MHIIGIASRIEIEISFNIPPDRETRVLVTSGGEPPTSPATETFVFPAVDRYTIQAERFARAILADAPVPVPLSVAVVNMTVIDTILSDAVSTSSQRRSSDVIWSAATGRHRQRGIRICQSFLPM